MTFDIIECHVIMSHYSIYEKNVKRFVGAATDASAGQMSKFIHFPTHPESSGYQVG